MLGLLRRLAGATPAAVKPPVLEGRCIGLTAEKCIMNTAEWHAFRALQLIEAGEDDEAYLHLQDGAEFLAQLGGPRKVKLAEEIYQWCAARRAGEV